MGNEVEVEQRKTELKEELAAVNQAIKDVLKAGQSYGLADRRWQGVSLKDLREHRRNLRNALNAMGGRVGNIAHGNVNC